MTHATAAKLHRPVTFARFTRHEFTLAAGSIVEYAGASLNGPGSIRVQFGGHWSTIDIDDASPVVWDEREEMWVEE